MRSSEKNERRRRLAAAALALPLALGMTGTAGASGGEQPAAAEQAAERAHVRTDAPVAGAAVERQTPAPPAGTTGPAAGTAPGPDVAQHRPVADPHAHGAPAAGLRIEPRPQPKADSDGATASARASAHQSAHANVHRSAERNVTSLGTPPCVGCTPATSRPQRTPDAPDTATMTVDADCRTVTVTSSKDISHVVVVFADGTSQKFGGLSGDTWTRTFDQDVAAVRAKSATTRVRTAATGCGRLPVAAPRPRPVDEKLTICHATGSATNPYVIITISKAGVVNGHYGTSHQGGRDIIPAFTYRGVSHAAQGDPALIATGCIPAAAAVGGGGGTVDVCPDIPGPQPMGPCTGTGGGGGTVDVDVCPEVTGHQPAGTVCTRPTSGNPPGQGTTDPPPVGPPTGLLPGVVPHAPNPPSVVPGPAVLPDSAPAPAPAQLPAQAAAPSMLPFTGTDAALLTELALLLLVAGAGVLAVARRERTARAA
jgi:hypothetical protein